MTKIFDKDTYKVLIEKVQEKDLPTISLNTLYITKHSNIRTKVTIPENTTIRSNIITQTEVNGTNVEVKRVVMRYKRNYNLIINIYINRVTNEYYGKVLTALTDTQLNLSRNMNKGKIQSAFNLVIQNVKEEDIFFNNKDYKDFLNH